MEPRRDNILTMSTLGVSAGAVFCQWSAALAPSRAASPHAIVAEPVSLSRRVAWQALAGNQSRCAPPLDLDKGNVRS